MKRLVLLGLLLLTGCELQSPDYLKIMESCSKKGGYYFSVTIPTWLGPRLVPGCAEDLRDMKFWTYKVIEEDNK